MWPFFNLDCYLNWSNVPSRNLNNWVFIFRSIIVYKIAFWRHPSPPSSVFLLSRHEKALIAANLLAWAFLFIHAEEQRAFLSYKITPLSVTQYSLLQIRHFLRHKTCYKGFFVLFWHKNTHIFDLFEEQLPT